MARRASVLLIAVLLATQLPIGSAQAQDTSVRISEVHPDPASDGREFIELWNTGDTTIDLAGWNLTDATNGSNVFTFDSWTLGPGDRVVVWGGGNDSALGPTWKANVWNNGGDTVRVVDPDGTLIDRMDYGTSDVPAPAKGVSLHWDGAWSTGDPTPGQDPQGSGGSATATVQDLPPEVTWVEAPTTVRPGDNTTVTFQIDDPNGDAITWNVAAADVEVQKGTGGGPFTVNATAPLDVGDWQWVIHAGSTVHNVQTAWTINITANPFRIVLPPEGIRFPSLAPGADQVTASADFTITNQADEALTPHLDISPFVGPGGAIPVDGNLQLQVSVNGTPLQHTSYDGPLQPLLVMDPGASVQVRMVLLQVPEPLAAGDYRSSFTVVP